MLHISLGKETEVDQNCKIAAMSFTSVCVGLACIILWNSVCLGAWSLSVSRRYPVSTQTVIIKILDKKKFLPHIATLHRSFRCYIKKQQHKAQNLWDNVPLCCKVLFELLLLKNSKIIINFRYPNIVVLMKILIICFLNVQLQEIIPSFINK